MTTKSPQADLFEANRKHLAAVAYRILGSRSEAEDAVQESWLRLSRTDITGIDNLTGWLTTVVARICLDLLRARKTRTEGALTTPAIERQASANDAQHDLEIAEAIGHALSVVVDALAPAERVAFVLHDVFNLPFEDIASIIHRSPAATRQLASRARRRLQGSVLPDSSRVQHQDIVAAFLAASRGGDLAALIAMLDPDVVLRADAAVIRANAARPGAPHLMPQSSGAASIAQVFKGRAQAAQLALIDGTPGFVFAPGGQLKAACEFIIENDRIVEIDLIGEPESLETLQLSIVDASARS